MMRAHPRCWDEQGQGYLHICHDPSGKECLEQGCVKEAGTLWSKYWCPEHDVKRQDQIHERLLKMQEEWRTKNPRRNA